MELSSIVARQSCSTKTDWLAVFTAHPPTFSLITQLLLLQILQSASIDWELLIFLVCIPTY